MSPEVEQWATVELMGHGQTAGRVLMENGLLRVDVPSDDAYRTEYYGLAAIYSIKIVSEEIARAYVRRTPDVVAYDTPIVTRAQHEQVVDQLTRRNDQLGYRIQELERRLVSVRALPSPGEGVHDHTGEVDEVDHDYRFEG